MNPLKAPASSAGPRRARLMALGALLLLLGSLISAHAQAQGGDPRALARRLAAEGFDALKRDAAALANERFTQALALYAAPTLHLGRGRARERLLQLRAAAEDFHHAVRFPVAHDESPIFAKAREEAAARLQRLERRIPSLRIDVTGAKPLWVTVNGQNLPLELLGVARPVDPGQYVVVVRGAGGAQHTASARLVEGDARAVALALPSEALAAAPIANTLPKSAPPEHVATESPGAPARMPDRPSSPANTRVDAHGMSTPALAMTIVTGILLASAIATAVIYMDKRGSFDRANSDPERADQRVRLREEAATIGLINATLSVGAATSGGIAAVLLLSGPEEKRDADGANVAGLGVQVHGAF